MTALLCKPMFACCGLVRAMLGTQACVQWVTTAKARSAGLPVLAAWRGRLGAGAVLQQAGGTWCSAAARRRQPATATRIKSVPPTTRPT